MKYNKRLSGSMTVEASFLFPIIIFCILTIMYFTLYQFDMVTMYSTMSEVALKENHTIRQPSNLETGEIYFEDIIRKDLKGALMEDSTIKEEVSDYLSNLLSDKLFIYEVDRVKVSCNSSEIIVKVQMSTKFCPPFGINYLSDFMSVNAQIVLPIHNPTEFVRVSDTALEVVTNIKGFEKIKSSIGKLVSVFQ